ncbi:MAG TPA: ATP-binding protein [Syntrophales bacterium]|nr:ATP-binding protein [Syntrophales bacterium]
MDDRFSTINKEVKQKFVLVGTSLIVFPALILVYMHYQADITFSYYVSTLFIIIGLIVLTGLYILYSIFNNVFSFAEAIIKELTEQANRSNVELSAIKDMANKAFQNRDFEDLLEAFLDAALSVTNSQIGSSFVVDPESNRMRLVGSRGIKGLKKGQVVDIDDSVIKHVITEKKPLLVKDIEKDPRTKKKNDPKYGSPSFLSIPISARHKGDVMAVINLSRKKTEESFDMKDEKLLSTMLIDVKLTLENAMLQSQVADYIDDMEKRNNQLEQEIAERKRAEEMQKRLHEELMQAEKLAAVGTFVAGIAHEVKNPLAIIIQGIEYLKTSTGPDDPLLNDVVERIKKSAHRADSIVRGLLSFTRQISIQTEKMDIKPVIEESLSFVENQIGAKHIKVERRYSPDAPPVNIDSDQIKQAFANIFLNSVEAMEDGGTITIDVQPVKNESNEQYLQIAFSDTGVGIPLDKIEKVFDPFFTTKDNLGNTGLGLSVTKGIVDKHHGKIRVESMVEEGTKVIVDLPVS